jgi:FAD:protein FMN transferase
VVKILLLLLFWFDGTTAQTNLVRYEDSRVSMACTYSIVAYGEDEKILKQAVTEAFDEVDRIDRLMSHYKPDSPLSQINREAGKRPVKVERELWEFLLDCRNFSLHTDGAFDITVGPLMKAWGFFRGEGRMPTARELLRAQASVGYRHVRFDIPNQTIWFDREGVELDLGGIAKGYAVDQATLILKSHQIQRALISAGGSTLYALGAPPDKDVWEVHLQDPLDARKIARTLQLRDEALSVSGSAEKFFELNGKRYSHIMNPRTGYPVMNMLSVAVITRTGLAGDALDNALYVTGAVKARNLLRRFPRAEKTEVLMFVPEKSRWKMIHIKHP